MISLEVSSMSRLKGIDIFRLLNVSPQDPKLHQKVIDQVLKAKENLRKELSEWHSLTGLDPNSEILPSDLLRQIYNTEIYRRAACVVLYPESKVIYELSNQIPKLTQTLDRTGAFLGSLSDDNEVGLSVDHPLITQDGWHLNEAEFVTIVKTLCQLKGNNKETIVPMELEELITGTVKRVSLPSNLGCPVCFGSGHLPVRVKGFRRADISFQSCHACINGYYPLTVDIHVPMVARHGHEIFVGGEEGVGPMKMMSHKAILSESLHHRFVRAFLGGRDTLFTHVALWPQELIQFGGHVIGKEIILLDARPFTAKVRMTDVFRVRPIINGVYGFWTRYTACGMPIVHENEIRYRGDIFVLFTYGQVITIELLRQIVLEHILLVECDRVSINNCFQHRREDVYLYKTPPRPRSGQAQGGRMGTSGSNSSSN